MITLFAQPYDISASGFYFTSEEEFNDKASNTRNDYSQPVEEFEIQFIDGEGIDSQLFSALGVHQGNIGGYLCAVEDWSEDDKIKVIIAVGEVGYKFDVKADTPDQFDLDLYDCDNLRDLAMQFVEDGLLGDIPASLQNYLDYDAIARDLALDYAQVTIDGTRYVYRMD